MSNLTSHQLRFIFLAFTASQTNTLSSYTHAQTQHSYLLLPQYHTSEELVLQPLHCHCKVNDRCTSTDLCRESSTVEYGPQYCPYKNLAQPEMNTLGCAAKKRALNNGWAFPCTYLWGVSRVRQLGGDVQGEPRQHVHLLVSNLHLQGPVR